MRTNLRTIGLVGIAFVAGFVLSYVVFVPSRSTLVTNVSAPASFLSLTPPDYGKATAAKEGDGTIKLRRGASAAERGNFNEFRFQWADPLAFPPGVAPASDRVPVRVVQPQMLQLPNPRMIEREPGTHPPNWWQHSTDLIDFRYQPDFRID